MSYSKIRKIRLSTYDRKWSKLARERTPYCEICRKTEYLAAHHFMRRGVKATRLMLDNSVVLCASHHVFSSDWSAHKTPEKFDRWFKKTHPDRYKVIIKRAQTMMTEREAIKEFERLCNES
jgi:hypothetical protein